MPITSTTTESYVIGGLRVDLDSMNMDAVLTRFLNGVVIGTVMVRFDTAAFVAFISSNPTANMTRQDDLTNAIYQHAIDTGVVTGEIS